LFAKCSANCQPRFCRFGEEVRWQRGVSKNKLNYSSPTDQATSSSRASAGTVVPLHLCQSETNTSSVRRRKLSMLPLMRMLMPELLQHRVQTKTMSRRPKQDFVAQAENPCGRRRFRSSLRNWRSRRKRLRQTVQMTTSMKVTMTLLVSTLLMMSQF